MMNTVSISESINEWYAKCRKLVAPMKASFPYGTVKYIFHFQAGDYEAGAVYDESIEVTATQVLPEAEVERYWDAIAEMYEQGFWRGHTEVHYLSCPVPAYYSAF